jgi:hypothetical protein
MQELFSLNDNLRDFDSVIIYGTGQAARGIFMKLLQRNIKVECYADSYPDNCGVTILGIPVYHIRELSDKTDSAIIVGGVYAFQVAAELKKMGFANIFYDFANECNIIHLEREDA